MSLQTSTPIEPQNEATTPDRTAGVVRIDVSEEAFDPSWDSFLQNAEGGHHVQTSLWGQLKSTIGWRVLRVIARREGEIIGGAQLLLRAIPFFGSVAYVPKGPVLSAESRPHLDEILRVLHQAARRNRVRMLILQPPSSNHDLTDKLLADGFYTSTFQPFPIGTTSVALHLSEEEILAKANSKMRYNIRLSRRKGVTVRRGTAEDLPTVFEMLSKTAQRKGYKEYSFDYFSDMQRLFGPPGHLEYFLSENEGEILSAMIVVAFGDTVLFKKGGWSGQAGHLHPNEAMHWEAICWAKRAGYRWYDFEGIDDDVAKAIVQGESRPSLSAVSRFKLGFGGDVIVHPDCLEYIYNPAVRRVRQLAARKSQNSRFMKFILKLVRK